MTSAEAQARTTEVTNDCSPMDDVEILIEIVIALVTRPEAVFVDEKHDNESSYFLVHVADEDLGKVIGKNGETVSTIRKLLGRISAGRGRKTFIRINERNRRPFERDLHQRVAPRRNAAA
jgi:hypothetical protein